MALLFLGPSLLPGKTLSNSDTIWFQPPFVSSKPAGLTTPSNPELGDATTQLQPFVHYTARTLPHIAEMVANRAPARRQARPTR